MNTRKTEYYTNHKERISVGGLERVFLQVSEMADTETDYNMTLISEHFLELSEAYKNLSKATCIIGYLESQLDALKEQEKHLDEIEAQAAKTNQLGNDHHNLVRNIEDLTAYADRSQELLSVNKTLMQRLNELSSTHAWWHNIFDQVRDMFGGERKLTMPEYYEMLDRSIRNTSTFSKGEHS
jgi:hypothetical protein